MMRRLRLDRSGASAAEFAMVLPLLILFIFGIIDGGRYLWEVNKAEKATQAGARVAVVTDALDSGLSDENYVDGTLTQGDVIPASALGELKCDSSGCNCESGTCPTVDQPDDYTDRFNRIVTRMSYMKPDIDAVDVTVSYRGSGLGFAGDPNGMDIAPLVTVELDNVMFRPLVLFGAAEFELPAFRTTLTAEDSSGSQSN
jgi:Flp pilus assembly protein TadG